MNRAFIIRVFQAAALLILGGCVFNVPITPVMGPLQEQELEGNGSKKIVVMDISGIITEKQDDKTFGPDYPSMPARIREELNKAAADKSVRGILVRINSPGGTVTASDIIYHEIVSFKKRTGKKVYAVITGLGTSGAYYAAAAADTIYAHPTAVTGSIGAIAIQVDASGLMEKLGIEDKSVKSGEKKDIFSPFRQDTPEEQKIMQEIIGSLHARFKDIVAAGRGERLSREDIERLADGRPYTAEQAREAGLIDEVGYMDEAIEAMIKDMGLRRARTVTYLRNGEYQGTIYTAPPGGLNVNLLSLDHLAGPPGVRFMYLWDPGL